MILKLNKAQLLLIIVTLLVACQQAPDSLRLGLSLQSIEKTNQLSNILTRHAKIELNIVEFIKGDQPLNMLMKRQIDLLVVENSTSYIDGLEAVLPLYTGVLHILYRSDLKLTVPKDLIKGRTLFLGNTSPVSRKFIETLAKHHGIDEKDYQIVDRFNPAITEVILVFSPISSVINRAVSFI